ncbi:MAG TPA: hypothetical protein VGF87_11225 [Acidimicrobiales bacterium]|jgi:hypothetical protein
MNKRFRRRIAGGALALASMGMVSTAVVLESAPAGAATTSNTAAVTCSGLCGLVQTIVFDVGSLLNFPNPLNAL